MNANEKKLIITTQQLRLYFYVFLVVISLIVRDIIGAGVPDVLFTAFSVFAFTTLDFEHSTIYLFFLLPLNCGLSFAESLLIYIVIGYYCKWFKMVANTKFVLCVVIMLIGFFHTVTSRSGLSFEAVMQWARLYVYLPIIYFLSEKALTKELKSILIKSFILGALCLGIIFVTENIRIEGIRGLINGTRRLGKLIKPSGTMMVTMNSNDFAMIMLVTFMSSIVLYGEKRISLLLTVAGVFGSFLMGLFTQSRTFIIGTVAYAIMWLLFSSKGKGKVFRNVILIACIIFTSAFIYRRFQTTLQMTLYRFEDDDISNGRFMIWGNYVQLITRNMFRLMFGYGEVNRLYYVSSLFGSQKSPHNMILDILSAWGIVGFISYVYLMIIIAREQTKGVVTSFFFRWVPLIVFFVFSMTLQYISYGYPIMITLLCIYLASIVERKEETSLNGYK